MKKMFTVEVVRHQMVLITVEAENAEEAAENAKLMASAEPDANWESIQDFDVYVEEQP